MQLLYIYMHYIAIAQGMLTLLLRPQCYCCTVLAQCPNLTLHKVVSVKLCDAKQNTATVTPSSKAARCHREDKGAHADDLFQRMTIP